MNLLNNHQIFCLFETYVVKDSVSYFSQFFLNYKLMWIPAIKSSKFGRASGGILIGIRSNILEKGFSFV